MRVGVYDGGRYVCDGVVEDSMSANVTRLVVFVVVEVARSMLRTV